MSQEDSEEELEKGEVVDEDEEHDDDDDDNVPLVASIRRSPQIQLEPLPESRFHCKWKWLLLLASITGALAYLKLHEIIQGGGAFDKEGPISHYTVEKRTHPSVESTDSTRSDPLRKKNKIITEKKKKKCSCFNSEAPRRCCSRSVLRTHKFGYMLTQGLFKPFDGLIKREKILPKALPNEIDYRHVVVTRNMYSAIVSGYLYHKSGRECWLTFNGWTAPRNKTFAWNKFITYDDPPFPPRKKRSICSYLAEESEEDGMRVYIDVALSKWYVGVVPYWEEVQQRLREDSQPRTRFVCFEDLSDPEKEESLFDGIMDWFFPGGHSYSIPVKVRHRGYSGGHSTSHDTELRNRLLALVERLDREVFDKRLASIDALFQCGGDT